MQGQDHGTITLATLCPGRPKPLTSHPVKVAPGSISRQLSSKIPVISAFPAHPPPPHHFLHCQVGHVFFSIHAGGPDFYVTATPPVKSGNQLLQYVTAIKWCCDWCARNYTNTPREPPTMQRADEGEVQAHTGA